MVASLGYQTLTFSSAEEFIRSDWVERTACVITDMQMPGLTGLELQDYLLKYALRTSIIMITAYPDEQLRAKAIEAGAVGFLTKPFDEKNFVDCLNAAIAA